MKNKTILDGADLFCGSGGTSTGLLQAARALKTPIRLVAVNHWDLAIATHIELSQAEIAALPEGYAEKYAEAQASPDRALEIADELRAWKQEVLM